MAKKANEHKEIPQTTLLISQGEFKKSLAERVQIGEEILQKKITTVPEFEELKERYNIWNDYNSEYLKQSFNNEYNEYRDRYDKCALFIGFAQGVRAQTPNDKISNFQEILSAKIFNLKKLEIKADLLKSKIEKSKNKKEDIMISNKIFIVHGHDERTKIDVARTIEKLGLDPIILSEQPNQGQTIIEKFELHSDVGFAVIILTADDLGRTKEETEDKYRARQNVLIEMGYFIGKLGRNKIFPLYENGVELPSDVHGVLYTPLDEIGNWKFKLAKELNAFGYNVDANKIL
ncbi:nucleotide-binding protein [Chryseobacterium luquanense]|uniref:Nucleotide-binding protein n=1 Tax=Chryseobacterium luquanense TaxID=2983766 RepID=A0ABT3Y917_9FLAO|nr:nucleotide-binding protein [Chryseobacterium luquanense]MCX8534608.1 nucleotide-binding protein [Chryseobacterium luquanense]